MTLLSQPGVNARDLISVQPVRRMPAVSQWENETFQALGNSIRVYSRKLGSAESYREGKQEQTVSYTLYADHRRGVTFPVREKDRIWHPKASDRNTDGTPNYETALTVDSVVEYDDEGVCVISAGRTF